MSSDTYYLNASELSSAISSYDNYLTQVSEQSKDVRSSINDFTSSSVSVLVGDVWDGVRNNLDKYDQYLEVSEAINEEMIATNKECLEIIQNFLQPDSDLNTADLPKFEAERDKLNQDIQTLKDEITKAEAVPPTRGNGIIDPETGIEGTEPNEPEYTNAQNTIKDNTVKIEELTKDLNETIRLIDKINQFTNEILPTVTKKLEEMEQYLQVFMEQVDALILSGSYSPRTGATSKTYNLDTQTGRMLYIYDQLTEKYGYSEWGAKAIIAQMYGTNSKFLPDRFQSDLPTNAGYGLCQWEYKKYGGTVDDAQMMEDWCKQNGYNHRTIDGQLAWLDHYLPIKANGYHDPEFYNELKTATEDDYYKMVCKFGTYHQGTQGDQYKNYNRAYNGDLLYGLFPVIDQRDSSDAGTTTSTTSSNAVLTELISTMHANSPRTTGDAETSSSSTGNVASAAGVLASAAAPAAAAAYSVGASSTGSTDSTNTGGSYTGVPISTDGSTFQQTNSSSESSGIPISSDGTSFQSTNNNSVNTPSPRTGGNTQTTETTQQRSETTREETTVKTNTDLKQIDDTSEKEKKTEIVKEEVKDDTTVENLDVSEKVETVKESIIEEKIEDGRNKTVSFETKTDDKTSFSSLMEKVNNEEEIVVDNAPVMNNETNNTSGKSGIVYNSNSEGTTPSVSETEEVVPDEKDEIKITDVNLSTSMVDEISKTAKEEKPIEIKDVELDDTQEIESDMSTQVATEDNKGNIAKEVLTGIGMTSSIGGVTGAAIYGNKQSKKRDEEEEEDEDEIKVQGEDEIENLI